MKGHERELQRAFDGQAAEFERSPVQADAAALQRLVAFARLPAGTRLLDAGCGPGLVAEAFLTAGCSVHGVDLSGEMLRRARERCARFGERASFEAGSVLTAHAGPFDAAVSRFVVHHVEDPPAFLRAQASRVRPGGTVVVSDHVTDPDPAAALWHQQIERARDRSHTTNLTSGGLADALAAAGVSGIEMAEEDLVLDFDEWFDRGTPALPKAQVRERVLAGRARGFEPKLRADGGITIRCIRVMARGTR